MRHVEDGIVLTRTEFSVFCKGLIVRMVRNSFMFSLLCRSDFSRGVMLRD